MQAVSYFARYLWLKAMDAICWIRGHSVTKFPKGRYCQRCYKVEGVDFPAQPQQRSTGIGRLVKGRKE